jgi:hypothetical protein
MSGRAHVGQNICGAGVSGVDVTQAGRLVRRVRTISESPKRRGSMASRLENIKVLKTLVHGFGLLEEAKTPKKISAPNDTGSVTFLTNGV